MANKNTKRKNNAARKARANERWMRLLNKNSELHKHTVRKP